MAQPASRPAPRLAPGDRDLDVSTARPAEGSRGRPHVILVVGPTEPGTRAMHSATWLGRRLGAEILVVAAVEYPPPRDELVDARVAAARQVVSATTRRLRREAVRAEGIVVAVRDGLGPATIDNLADGREAELVAVASPRRSWFRVFPGSALGHQLTRTAHRPVLIIPDQRPGAGAWIRAWFGGTRRELSTEEAC